MANAYIVCLDAGPNFIRTLLFDASARVVEGYGARAQVAPGASADDLSNLAADCLEEVHRQVAADGFPVLAVAAISSWPDLPAPAPQLAAVLNSDWPSFKTAAWLAPIPAGVALAIGSGCLARDRFSLAFGHAGGVRVTVEGTVPGEHPSDFTQTAIDAQRTLIENSLSGASATMDWMRRVLALPRGLEARLDASIPGSHGVTVLPFIENRGMISGFSLGTEAFDLYLAAFESAALRAREAVNALAGWIGLPREIIAAGSALLNSPAAVQMLADALGYSITLCTEPEPAARGAALRGLHLGGVISDINALLPQLGTVFAPREYQRSAYEALAQRERALAAKFS
jgi:gluconokinase